jgi:hypothetical protein
MRLSSSAVKQILGIRFVDSAGSRTLISPLPAPEPYSTISKARPPEPQKGCPLMDDANRFRRLGIYRTPRFRIGQRIHCHVRGEVVISGTSDAPRRSEVLRSGDGQGRSLPHLRYFRGR